MFWIIMAVLCAVLALFAPSILERQGIGMFVRQAVRLALLGAVFFCITATSFVVIGTNETGHLSRVYLGAQLPPGQIIALDGEKGPQAQILGPGFNFRLLLNVLYDVEKYEVLEVPAGQYAKLTAKDGKSLRPGQTFADMVLPTVDEMIDAEKFLRGGGQRGQQIFVLTPGKYRINSYLWNVELDNSTDIPKGFVGVVKSNVHAAANVGDMNAEKPKSCKPTKETDLSGGKLSVPLVPVGCIGIWNTAILPGRYYLNKDVYTITLMDTRVQAWEFKGGFKRRSVALTVDQQGKITQTPSEYEEPQKPQYTDKAVFLKVEGWDIPQELRVLVQITPDNAPIVVASVGDEKEVESRIIVPIVRAIVRDVTGGGFMEFPEQDKDGSIVQVVRAPRVLDLLDNRAVLEAKILKVMQPEGQKAGVEIKEVRFGDPAVPPELLVARLREQLAHQLSESYKQEEIAQKDRINSENARALADQQENLVAAEIDLQRAEKLKDAAKLIGEGEKLKLEAIAQGQKAQALVLGEDRVTELRKFELIVDRGFGLLEKNPELITAAMANVGKLVPNTVVTTGDKGGLDGAAAIFGAFMTDDAKKGSKQ